MAWFINMRFTYYETNSYYYKCINECLSWVHYNFDNGAFMCYHNICDREKMLTFENAVLYHRNSTYTDKISPKCNKYKKQKKLKLFHEPDSLIDRFINICNHYY